MDLVFHISTSSLRQWSCLWPLFVVRSRFGVLRLASRPKAKDSKVVTMQANSGKPKHLPDLSHRLSKQETNEGFPESAPEGDSGLGSLIGCQAPDSRRAKINRASGCTTYW